MSIARENSSKVVDGGKGHRKGTDARYVIEISVGSSSTQFSFFFLNQSGKEREERKAREMVFLYHDSVQANVAV